MRGRYVEFIARAAKSIDRARIHTDPLLRYACGTDASFYRLTPQAVVDVCDEAEVQAVLAAAKHCGVGVTFRAAGTSLSGQASTSQVLVRAGRGWESCEISADGSVVRVGVGIRGGRLNALLKPFGRKAGPDPASMAAAMIGGIIANNASGMNGASENAYRTLRSVRIVLPDGTLLDTGSHASREEFMHSHRDFVARIIELREATRANRPLAELIRRKYSIKNTTGLNIAPFVDFDDPFDIIAHLMVGSEGTLAFISRVELDTLPVLPCKAAAMLWFGDLAEACRAVQSLKALGIETAELLDRGALRAVENEDGVPALIRTLPDGAAAALIEIKAADRPELDRRVEAVTGAIGRFATLRPAEFTVDTAHMAELWRIRSGVFPAVGAMRRAGSACLIEDVVFPLERMPEAVAELRTLLNAGGYADAVIYGHAAEGNFHFILTPDFADPDEIQRFGRLMESVAGLIERCGGSLKGEHGTGRNVAPFVRREWGDEAHKLMSDVKRLFDPGGVLGPGVIFNDDAGCHLKHLKRLTPASPATDRCIECGFCEPGCVTAGLTLSARQRTAAWREITRLGRDGDDPAQLAAMIRRFAYFGADTCAGDGLCAMSCPVRIDTGDMVREIRGMSAGACSRRLARGAADRFAAVSSGVRAGLKMVDGVHGLLGTGAMSATAGALRKLSGGAIPLWTPAMPRATDGPPEYPAPQSAPGEKVVYFPSCINRVMGPAADDRDGEPLHKVFTKLLRRAGYEAVFPRGLSRLCCGTIWESKGFAADADRKTAELREALLEASEGGRYPVVCDQSPCLKRMHAKIKGVEIYESVEFIDIFVAPRLTFERKPGPVALHITCSTRLRGGDEAMRRLAGLCADRVIEPDGTGCCGFAGDKGFTHPEINAFALRDLRRTVEEAGAREGYSNSRTCEIGLSTHSGIIYRSLVCLVEECTRGSNGKKS